MNTKSLSPYLLVLAFAFISSCAKPIANFSYNPEKAKVPARINFKNESQKAIQYEWDFGDGSTSKEAAPNHQYLSSGNYEVSLKAINKKKQNTIKKRIVVDAPSACMVMMETKYGNMLIELFDATPKHRDNFIELVEKGYYDDLIFHRIISGFMIQGGDPRSRNANMEVNLGGGGPKYRIPAEFVDTLAHIKGALAAARTGGPGNPRKESSGSQFYIVQGTPISSASLDNFEKTKGIKYSVEQREIYTTIGGTPQLDQEYTVFGRVVDGLDVIDKIANVKTNSRDRPMENVIMKIKIIN